MGAKQTCGKLVALGTDMWVAETSYGHSHRPLPLLSHEAVCSSIWKPGPAAPELSRASRGAASPVVESQVLQGRAGAARKDGRREEDEQSSERASVLCFRFCLSHLSGCQEGPLPWFLARSSLFSFLLPPPLSLSLTKRIFKVNGMVESHRLRTSSPPSIS